MEDVEGDGSSGTDQDVKPSLVVTKQPIAPPVTKKSKSKAPPNKKNDNSKKKKNDDGGGDDDDDDSSTASDTSIFDAKMQGDIMAQLAKL